MSIFNPARVKWHDPLPARELEAAIKVRTMTPQERWARVESVIDMCGFRSKAEALRYTGLTNSQLAAMKNKNPSLSSILRVATAFNVSYDLLLNRVAARG